MQIFFIIFYQNKMFKTYKNEGSSPTIACKRGLKKTFVIYGSEEEIFPFLVFDDF